MTSMVQRIISDAIEHKLNDPRVAPLTTVSRVRMTGDLTVATVYLTVPGGDVLERQTLVAIRHATGYLQRMLAHELQVRQCPELRFEMDEAAKRAKETMRLIAENERNRPDRAASSDAPTAAEGLAGRDDEADRADVGADGEGE
jgi:ribosome-binding factor A